VIEHLHKQRAKASKGATCPHRSEQRRATNSSGEHCNSAPPASSTRRASEANMDNLVASNGTLVARSSYPNPVRSNGDGRRGEGQWVYLQQSWNRLGPSRRQRKDDRSERATVPRRQGVGGARGPALFPVRRVHGRGQSSLLPCAVSPTGSAVFGGHEEAAGLLGFGWRASKERVNGCTCGGVGIAWVHHSASKRTTDPEGRWHRAIRVREEHAGLPCFLFGESMGGGGPCRSHVQYLRSDPLRLGAVRKQRGF
jgi:hypothetical protein